MAKKKTRKKVIKPPQPKLSTVFDCPECGHKKSIIIHFNRRDNKGKLLCKSCGVDYEGKLKKAAAFIDIYYEWLDKRELEKKRKEEMRKNDDDEEEEEENEANEENEDDYGKEFDEDDGKEEEEFKDDIADDEESY